MWRNSNNPKGVAQRERLGKRILDAKIGHKTEMSLAIKSRRERGRGGEKWQEIHVKRTTNL